MTPDLFAVYLTQSVPTQPLMRSWQPIVAAVQPALLHVVVHAMQVPVEQSPQLLSQSVVQHLLLRQKPLWQSPFAAHVSPAFSLQSPPVVQTPALGVLCVSEGAAARPPARPPVRPPVRPPARPPAQLTGVGRAVAAFAAHARRRERARVGRVGAVGHNATRRVDARRRRHRRDGAPRAAAFFHGAEAGARHLAAALVGRAGVELARVCVEALGAIQALHRRTERLGATAAIDNRRQGARGGVCRRARRSPARRRAGRRARARAGAARLARRTAGRAAAHAVDAVAAQAVAADRARLAEIQLDARAGGVAHAGHRARQRKTRSGARRPHPLFGQLPSTSERLLKHTSAVVSEVVAADNG